MVRPLRIEYPGAVYHIISRGNAKNDIFLNDEDRNSFLNIFSEAIKKYNLICYAYCLMSNHYHLLIETPDGNLSISMRYLNGVYTQKFNRKNNKVGHVFQGRFKSILVDKESYLLELCRYIELNPVREQLISKPEDWQYSSYPSRIRVSDSQDLIENNFILEQFDKDLVSSIELYKQFISDGINKKGIKFSKGIVLGNDDFKNKIQSYIEKRALSKEIIRNDRVFNRPKLASIFPDNDRKCIRDKDFYDAHIEYGYTLAEIAKFTGFHYSTISKRLNNIRKIRDNSQFKT
ncbi:transposase [Elusimicrobiota bacterium]